MLIREERAEDAAVVDALVHAAFAGHPHSDGSEVAVMAGLRQAGRGILALVAVDHDDVVGQAAFSPVTVDGRPSDWYGLGPLAVRPDRQNRGIGSALVRHGLGRIRAEGAAGCVVLGDTGYYARFGFRLDPRLNAPGLPAEHFMALPFGLEVPTGAIAYHPAFTSAG